VQLRYGGTDGQQPSSGFETCCRLPGALQTYASRCAYLTHEFFDLLEGARYGPAVRSRRAIDVVRLRTASRGPGAGCGGEAVGDGAKDGFRPIGRCS
jgi:hypothetical protein